jgi:hypothetical protein
MLLALELLQLVVAAVQIVAVLEVAVAAGVEVEIDLLMGCKDFKKIMRMMLYT